MGDLLAILLGLLAGAVGGLVGVGGGILFVPALTIFLDQNQVEAEATSLFAIIFVSVVGTWRQRVYGNVRLGDAFWIGMLSLPGAVAGVAIANAIPRRTLQILFALLVLLVAVQIAIRARREPRV
jgi:uncharacterized membrane protein YfcA